MSDNIGTGNNAAPTLNTEADLVEYWRQLGGTAGWKEKTTPEALKQALATCKVEKINAAVKQGEWVHEVVIMEEDELAGYVSVVASRLPKLRKLRIYGAKTVPFDYEEIDAVENAFPKLEHIGLIRTNWTEEQIVEMTEHFPHLKTTSKLLSRGCGIGVYRDNGPTKKPDELHDIRARNKKMEYLD